jgi:RimJ/RimL family protein N-acetyltransferase
MSSAPPRSPIPKLDELPLEIDTPRVRLRPPRESDADAFFPYVSEPELSRYVTWAAHAHVDDTREWLRKGQEMVAKGGDMIWTLEHEGSPCGCIGLHGITWAVRAVRFDKAEMGYWLARPLWGEGLMTEAATAALRWAFETLGLHKITIGCFEENVGSRRVIEKLGFRYLCRYEDDVWRDGRWFAHLRYELTASEWADSTRTLRFHRPHA